MPFANPIVAGVELVRDAIQSADYVPGVSGWAIRRDGSAEFTAGTFRGELLVVGTDGSQVRAYAAAGVGAVIELKPAGGATAATLRASGGVVTLAADAGLRVSPRAPANPDGSPVPGGDVDVDGLLRVGGVDQGRGLVASNLSTAILTGSVGTSLTNTFPPKNVVFQPGRAYRLEYKTGFRTSAAGVLAYWRVDVGGVVVGEGFRFRGEGTPVMNAEWSTRFTYQGPGALLAARRAVTTQGLASSGTFDDWAAPGSPRGWRLYDIGAAGDYPDDPVLT